MEDTEKIARSSSSPASAVWGGGKCDILPRNNPRRRRQSKIKQSKIENSPGALCVSVVSCVMGV